VGNKPLPKAGKVVDHRSHLLSQRAASKTKLPCKTEKQTANWNLTQTVKGVGVTLNLPLRKRQGKIPVNKHSNKPLPKQGR
jgi:hypothetical protein